MNFNKENEVAFGKLCVQYNRRIKRIRARRDFLTMHYSDLVPTFNGSMNVRGHVARYVTAFFYNPSLGVGPYTNVNVRFTQEYSDIAWEVYITTTDMRNSKETPYRTRLCGKFHCAGLYFPLAKSKPFKVIEMARNLAEQMHSLHAEVHDGKAKG